MINQITKDKIAALKSEYNRVVTSRTQGLREIAISEVPEMVYNSNAIENSTLTLVDTEAILMREVIRKDVNIREVYETKTWLK